VKKVERRDGAGKTGILVRQVARFLFVRPLLAADLIKRIGKGKNVQLQDPTHAQDGRRAGWLLLIL
jgi:hypothetical protein